MTLVREFELACGAHNVPGYPRVPDEAKIRLRLRLMKEELAEVEAELVKMLRPGLSIEAKQELLGLLLKELADLRYVTDGTAVNFGLDIDGAAAEVHRSNMSKLKDGRIIKDQGGKVLKGPDYSPADMTKFVHPIIHLVPEEEE